MEFQAGTTRGIAGVQSARWIQIEKKKGFFAYLQILCMLFAPIGLIPIISWNLELE